MFGSMNLRLVVSLTAENGVGRCGPDGSGKAPAHLLVWSVSKPMAYSVANLGLPFFAGFRSGDTLAGA